MATGAAGATIAGIRFSGLRVDYAGMFTHVVAIGGRRLTIVHLRRYAFKLYH